MLQRQRAFTLIELMVALAVLGVVIGIAVPSFITMMANSRSAALGEDFATAINFVRSEAVKRHAKVSLCASSDGATCVAANGWQDGFIAFVDNAIADNSAAPVLPDGGGVVTILRVWEKQNANAVIAVSQGGAASFLRYTRMGYLAPVVNSSVIVNAYITGCTGTASRKITVGVSGMVTVEKTACP